jgi:integrase/recombinase XerD
MIEGLQLRGLSERTQEAYVRAVRQLAEHYHKSPDQITEEELRQYFLYLNNVKKYARPTLTIAICGIRFLFEKTLQRDWAIFGLVRPPREQKLPVVLSLAEVRKILSRPTTVLQSLLVNDLFLRPPVAGGHPPASTRYR